MLDVDGFFTLAVRHRQPATGRQRLDRPVDLFQQLGNGVADLAQVAVVDAGADVHVHADQVQVVTAQQFERLLKLFMPDAVLAVGAAGIGLGAVAMAETRVDAQPDPVSRRALAQLLNHVQ